MDSARNLTGSGCLRRKGTEAVPFLEGSLLTGKLKLLGVNFLKNKDLRRFQVGCPVFLLTFKKKKMLL